MNTLLDRVAPIFKLLICGACLAFSSYCLAEAGSIEIVKSEGSVSLSDAIQEQQKSIFSRNAQPSKRILTTGANGRALVRVSHSGFIVLEKNSQIEISDTKDNAQFFRHVTGMIYYALNSIKEKQRPTQVRISGATLGIRGTRFLVTDISGRNEVGMRKGLISVTNPDGEFEIHKKNGQEAFEAFKQEGTEAIAKENTEFEKFKSDTENEFIEYKREFSLGKNRMASFDGKRVVDQPLNAGTQKEMESAEVYADEWLKQVRD